LKKRIVGNYDDEGNELLLPSTEQIPNTTILRKGDSLRAVVSGWWRYVEDNSQLYTLSRTGLRIGLGALF